MVQKDLSNTRQGKFLLFALFLNFVTLEVSYRTCSEMIYPIRAGYNLEKVGVMQTECLINTFEIFEIFRLIWK